MHQLCVGTAQWGSGYGVTNTAGRLSDDACAAIIQVMDEFDLTSIDTALAYGDAQERLRPWAREFVITTKVSGTAVAAQLQASLVALGVDHVHTVLLHDWDALDARAREEAVTDLRRVLDERLATRVGVSIYDEVGIRTALDHFAAQGVALGAMQLPGNVLDRRLDDADVMRTLVDRGTHVQLRSVFLQGLLAQVTPSNLGAHSDVSAFHHQVAEWGLSPVDVALAHVKSLPWVDEVVIGVTSGQELRVIAESWARVDPVRAPEDLASRDLDLLDPRRWK